MKNITMGVAGMFSVLVLAGCGPELAETQEGAREQEWRRVISESYPSWQAPRAAAPAQYDNVSPELMAAREGAEAPAAPAEAAPAEPTVPEPAADGESVGLPATEPAPAAEAAPAEKAEAAPAEAAPAEKAEAAPEEKFEEYTVVAGDTLSKIAQKVYHDGRLYNRIFKANEDVLKGDPNKLRIGMKLRIPAL